MYFNLIFRAYSQFSALIDAVSYRAIKSLYNIPVKVFMLSPTLEEKSSNLQSKLTIAMNCRMTCNFKYH